MLEKHLFEYSIIRLVPCVEREEFLNVGVILYCPSQNFLKTVYEINKTRLELFHPNFDISELEERLKAFVSICQGVAEGGTIGKLPIASRFRWLTATRSTVVQTSKVHPGFCGEPQATIQRLLNSLVN